MKWSGRGCSGGLNRPTTPSVAASAAPAWVSPLGALRILLAEDHPTNQKVVQLILGAVDLTPVVVGDGQAALDAMAAEPFDVVLMDMQMPVLDGLSATAEIRRREAALGRPRTPVIMLTANALEEHVQAGQAAGGDWHLSKPIRAEDLLGAIAAVTAPPDDPQKARA